MSGRELLFSGDAAVAAINIAHRGLNILEKIGVKPGEQSARGHSWLSPYRIMTGSVANDAVTW